MYIREDGVIISGQFFSKDLFKYLLTHFKEAFSHSSLTIEKAFKELDDFDLALTNSMDDKSHKYFMLLNYKEKRDVLYLLHQIIVYRGSKYGVFSEPLKGTKKQTEELYQKYFSYFDPYLSYYIVFSKKGVVNKKKTFQKVGELFVNLPQKEAAYKKAYNMQKDHMDAFDYAVEKEKIGLSETIRINEIVNNSDEDTIPGYKKFNNCILGAKFDTTDRLDVPFEMQNLYNDYDHDFDLELLDPTEPGITNEERYNRTCEIFKKEALFHIRFIRIHPFGDGNGRTGRIILNQHLLKQKLAPVMISNVMSDDYRRCINEFDVDGLAKLFLMSSSLQLANWVSMKKSHPTIHKKDLAIKNSTMAHLLGYYDNDIYNKEKKSFSEIGRTYLY
ncbi:MAG: Fic family protein [Bacilli bacterium]|nr:Fic family protein [Bacilli bacterium]